ncbi:cobalamin biosynthesis protein, partial [Prochlorococcus sp. AH-736-K09]|nr:cobalamin biosynthesis protein [Prochlorococcus sp. AH-736-K09]
MEGIAIGLSSNSKEILKRLKKTEFVKEIYIASSSKNDVIENDFVKLERPREILLKQWLELDLIIFIGSIGASIRIINPFLKSKDKDPGVIVIDNKCSKIVPLLGLHQSNTQNIAYQISNLLGGQIIETNNSKDQGFLNLDSFGNQWGWKRSGKIENWSKIVIKQAKNEEIFCKQLSGNSLWQTSESGERINQIYDKETEQPNSTFHVSVFENNEKTWHPPVLWVGIGCERNTSKELIANSLNKFLELSNISPHSIAGFATIDIKKDEKGILELAKQNNFPIKFFTKEDLSKIIVPNPSSIVRKEIGISSVAEASCLIAAGEESKLLKEKKIFKNQSGAVTIAVAESKNQYYPINGEIHIIGSGPGDISFLTNNAREALSKCTVWIGYKMYLDFIKPLKRSDQVLIESKLTEEKERCSKAIKLAEEGIKVALISSGESGFYGMAGLVLELLQKIKKEY